jgi:hypothetical protein
MVIKYARTTCPVVCWVSGRYVNQAQASSTAIRAGRSPSDGLTFPGPG